MAMSIQGLDEASINNILDENESLRSELKEVKKKNEIQNLEIVKMMVEIEDDNRILSQMNEKVNQNFDRIINLLRRIIELKEPGYVDHTERMNEIAVYIAEKINLSPAQIEYLKLAVNIHEVGIIAIPDRLINTNQSELTKEERKMLRQQSLIGARLLEQEEGFEHVSNIIKHMNEYIDGSGIPDGLSGSEIPIESQILLVVDTFSSLIYKKKNQLSVKKAMKYIENKTGILFNELIVSHLYNYVKDNNLIDDMPREVAISISELKDKMVLSRDLYTSSNILLAPKDTRITKAGIAMIEKFNRRDPILSGIYITANT